VKQAYSIAILFIAFSAVSTGATAQNVYKCGANTYSQIPCPEGIKLAPTKAPDSADKKQTDQATVRDASLADRMEKTRLKQEQLDLKANTPAPAKVIKAPAVRTRKVVKTKDFVAEVPGTKKSRTAKRRSTAD
jgi:hypothetical protein